MLLGMRTLKTAAGVALCLLLSRFLQLGNPLFAVIAFIVVMQNTLSDTFAVGKFRIYGTLLGGLLGGIFYLISPGSIPLAGLGIILIIVIMNHFRWSPAITIGLIVFISILAGDPPEYSIWASASIRVVDTIVGIIIAFAINFFISPPEYEGQLVQHLKTLRNQEWIYLHDLLSLGEKPPLREMVQTMDQANTTAATMEKETLPIKWWRRRSAYGLSDTLKNRLYHLSRGFIHLGILKELPLCETLSPDNLAALQELNISLPEKGEGAVTPGAMKDQPSPQVFEDEQEGTWVLPGKDNGSLLLQGKESGFSSQNSSPSGDQPNCTFSFQEEATLFNYHLMRLLFHLKESDKLEK